MISRALPAFLLALLLLCSGAPALPTNELVVSVYGPDGTTVLNSTTVTCHWMEVNLPVQGDGVTHYYHQGPVFVESKEGQWDPGETANFKDMGAVKGTAVRDLCDLVGGMMPDDDVMVKAVDGYHVEIPYRNIYNPEPRQGNITVCWFIGEEAAVGERQGTGYPPSYHVGMRLLFLADTSTNTEGKHVFGNWDMHEVMPPERIHLFEDLYPSTSGYTVKWVDEVRIYRGGYTGSADNLPKSYESKMEEVYPPPPTSAPLLFITIIAGLGVLGVGRRRK
jgi:hypothetical protein